MTVNLNENGDSSPYSLTAVGDLLFFSADDGVHGKEIWKCTGEIEHQIFYD